MGKKILIIKLASAGDVLRTTVLLSGLREKHPGCRITWLVENHGQELLEGNAKIERTLVYNKETVSLLRNERFDIVISLDKAIEATSLATLIRATEKYGFGLDKNGKMCPFNKEAEYSFILGIDDDLKFFKNTRTYQEITFESVNLDYKGNPYELVLDKKYIDFAADFFNQHNLDKNDLIIGINTGAGRVFANKFLRPDRIIELIELLHADLDAKILLLGGPLELEIIKYIKRKSSCELIDGGCNNSLMQFAALIDKCSLVITADTLALHIAIALRRPVVALFGPTCPQEIELYNLGHKIVTDTDCAPCYKNRCNKETTCMDRIKIRDIVETIKTLVNTLEIVLLRPQ